MLMSKIEHTLTEQPIYISGKISGLDVSKSNLLFNKAEQYLRKLGYTDIVNPKKLDHFTHDKSWEAYMRKDLKGMLDCKSLYMIHNYVNSRGARIEYELAIKLGFEVIYGNESDLNIS